MNLCLILKPPLIQQGKVGEVLQKLESLGCRVMDIVSMDLTTEDIYEFFELQIKFPSEIEVGSFLGGPVVVVGLAQYEDVAALAKQYPLYFSPNPTTGEVDCRFWFGG